MGYFPSFDAAYMSLDGDSSLPTATGVSLASSQPLLDYSDDSETNMADVATSALNAAAGIGSTLVTSMTQQSLAKQAATTALQSKVVSSTLAQSSIKSIGSMLIIGLVILVVVVMVLRKGL